jgi:predicted Zn-dependent protease with MMP-like domain
MLSISTQRIYLYKKLTTSWMKQFLLTPAAGKRLIGIALAAHPAIQAALSSDTLVIVAGTIAEEILKNLGQADGFSRKSFFRGVVLPPGKTTAQGRLPDESGFPGDVMIAKGIWQKDKSIFDVADGMKEGDIILKGANALDLACRQAAVLIGHPQGGTTIAALQASAGRRVRLILPVGLEKRIPGDLMGLACRLNLPGQSGFRLLPVPGEVFTEIDAIRLMTGAEAEIIAAGGISGAEGSVWLAVEGDEEEVERAEELLRKVWQEREFSL